MEAVRMARAFHHAGYVLLTLRNSDQAWKEGNDSLARYMLQYITGGVDTSFPPNVPHSSYDDLENDSERLALIPVRDVSALYVPPLRKQKVH